MFLNVLGRGLWLLKYVEFHKIVLVKENFNRFPKKKDGILCINMNANGISNKKEWKHPRANLSFR